MHLEEKRNYREAKLGKGRRRKEEGRSVVLFVTLTFSFFLFPFSFLKELVNPRLHHRVDPRLEFLALRRVGEDLGGQSASFGRVGDEFVNNVVGVDRLDAKLVQITRKEGFAAGNPSRQADSWLSHARSADSAKITPPWAPPSRRRSPPQPRSCEARGQTA